MKPENEDKIISDYFNAHKDVIEDNGFSVRVVNKLPKQKNNSWLRSILIYTAIFASALLIFLTINKLIKELVTEDLTHISIFVICFGISLYSIIWAANNSDESASWA